MHGTSKASEAPPPSQPLREVEQARRARRLIEQAEKETADRDLRFVLLVGALHLARSIVEHWYTMADTIPSRIDKTGPEAADLAKRLRREFETIFCRARRYDLLTELRGWDYHWGPVRHPETVGPNDSYGQGAPLTLSTGPNANSSVALRMDTMELETRGSGKRVGRKNYYRIQGGRFVDFEASEVLPLELALREFLDDLPALVQQAENIPEVQAYIATLWTPPPPSQGSAG
jgi:hypothetical protein